MYDIILGNITVIYSEIQYIFEVQVLSCDSEPTEVEESLRCTTPGVKYNFY